MVSRNLSSVLHSQGFSNNPWTKQNQTSHIDKYFFKIHPSVDLKLSLCLPRGFLQ